MMFLFCSVAESIIPPFLEHLQREQPVVHTFRPTAARCCRVGQRTARRMMSCSTYSGQRLLNSVHSVRGDSDAFTSKVTECTANFATSFEKCCVNKENFLKEIRMCRRRYTDRVFRAKCIKIAKAKYRQWDGLIAAIIVWRDVRGSFLYLISNTMYWPCFVSM